MANISKCLVLFGGQLCYTNWCDFRIEIALLLLLLVTWRWNRFNSATYFEKMKSKTSLHFDQKLFLG